jgi:omega-6 fatty acid desaturase (delta-12 desaturase)
MVYRLSRNAFVLLTLGPLYLFVLKYRLPVGLMRSGKGPWISAMATNLAIAAVAVGMAALVGIQSFLLIQLPVTLLAGTAGVWLFYVQHQFEDAAWARQDEWGFYRAAMQGSTHYDLPALLRWFTANIGVHHVHHLASRVPSYRLREILADHPQLCDVGRLTLRQSLTCFRLSLWDEDARRLVPFRALRTPGVAR